MLRAAEPNYAALYLDGDEVGTMDKEGGVSIHLAEQEEVVLERSYPVWCVVRGGNPKPAVRLSSGGDIHYEHVTIAHRTERDPAHRMSRPLHEMNASMTWTATVSNIGLPLNCSSGVEEERAVWTSFVPIVADSKPYAVN